MKRSTKAAIIGFLVGFLVVEVGGYYASNDPAGCADLCGLNLVVIFPFAILAGLICALVAAAIASRSQRW